MLCGLFLLLLNFHALNAYYPLTPAIGPVRQYTTSRGLTAEEVLERARKAAGIPLEERSAPKIFEENTLSDMQSALLKLERRVQEGPGSLTILEVEEFAGEMSRIVTEMHQNPHKRAPRLDQKEIDRPLVDISSPDTRLIGQTTDPSSLFHKSDVVSQLTRAVKDSSHDEGPAYDGIGLARGTVNTYVIDGMDGMSAEEYQKALQDSIIERQRKRREAGVTGNRATWDYLTSLGGSTGVLKEDKDNDEGSKRTKKKGFKAF